MAIGDFGALLHEKKLISSAAGVAQKISLAHATGDISCIVYNITGTDIILATFSINPGTGIVGDVLDSATIVSGVNVSSSGYVIKYANGIVVVAITSVTSEVRLYSYSIAGDGTIAAINNVQIVATGNPIRALPVLVTSLMIAVGYKNGSSRPEIVTIAITADGTLGAILDTQEIRAATFGGQGVQTVGMGKVRDPDIWAFGRSAGALSTDDTLIMSFTINETTGVVAAYTDEDIAHSSNFGLNQIISFLSTESDGQFLALSNRTQSGSRAQRLFSYQVDAVLELGTVLDDVLLTSGGAVRDYSWGIYLGGRVFLWTSGETSPDKTETYIVASDGTVALYDTAVIAINSPIWPFFMHPPNF